MSKMTIKSPLNLLFKCMVVFGPTYAVALLTNQMIYVIPTLAAGLLLGNSLKESDGEDANDSQDTDAGE